MDGEWHFYLLLPMLLSAVQRLG
jgi:peptidoglycan/LPS O-acetylase OafA/YrhL